MGSVGEDLAVEERIRYELDGVSPRRQAIDKAIRQVSMTVAMTGAGHWVLLFNTVIGVTIAGSLAAAYFAATGQRELANVIYNAYLLLCPQRPSHSFFLWGQKVALEQRVLVIYAAMLVAGLLLSLLRTRVRALDWRLALLLGVPMLIDVLSQTVGYRDSDWLWRATTGAVFGLAVVWWAFPRIDECLRLLGWTNE
ncbi:MAG: DUF2085 domain-containing protein [Chloroflexota bacterium]